MIIEQYIDVAGFIRIIWQMANGNAIMLKYRTQPTLEELQSREAIYMEQFELNSLPPIKIDIDDNIELLKDIIYRIKDNPSLTLTQYNNYLNTLSWYEATMIRYFIYKLALGLATHYNIDISDFSESQVLLKVRNWIVETPIKKIGKIIFNQINL